MTEAVIFNGQGSEFAGMGKFFYRESLIFKETIDAADACLDFDLPAYLFGTTPLVARPEALQPALVAYLVALYRASDRRPGRLLGLSLGEYAALIAGGMVSLEDGLHLVAVRGQAMAAACQANPGGMLALRAQRSQIQPLLALPEVWLANRNAPTQLVLGGTLAGMQAARRLARELGLKGLPLRVAGAFHTPLMAPAQDRLAQALNAVAWRPARVPVVSTTTHEPFTPANVVATLTAQVATQTDLARGIADAIAAGMTRITEVGPRPVLAKALAKQAPNTVVTSLDDTVTLKGAAADVFNP